MKRKPYPSEQQDRFIIRFPDGMRDLIAEEAKQNNRSMNAEIIARLQSTFTSHQNKDHEGRAGQIEFTIDLKEALTEKMTENLKRLGIDIDTTEPIKTISLIYDPNKKKSA